MSQNFKIVTWNINGLGNTLPNIQLAHKGLKGFFQHLGAHAICFQECKMPESKMSKEVVMVDGYESFWAVSQPPKTGYSGCTTYVHKQYSPTAAEADNLGSSVAAELGQDDFFGDQPDIDKEGRFVLTDLAEFVLINVYVPNAGDHTGRARLGFKCRFLEALRAKMDALRSAGREVVLVGDLNVAAAKRDVHPSIPYDEIYEERELQLLHSMISAYPDVWRRSHPDTEGCYTVWEERTNARSRNAGLRLDYALVSPGLLPRVVSCEILYNMPPKWSDHAPLVLELSGVPPPPPHPPCALSSEKNRRFNDRGQAKISSLFAAAQGGSSKKGVETPKGSINPQRGPSKQEQQQQQQQQQQQGEDIGPELRSREAAGRLGDTASCAVNGAASRAVGGPVSGPDIAAAEGGAVQQQGAPGVRAAVASAENEGELMQGLRAGSEGAGADGDTGSHAPSTSTIQQQQQLQQQQHQEPLFEEPSQPSAGQQRQQQRQQQQAGAPSLAHGPPSSQDRQQVSMQKQGTEVGSSSRASTSSAKSAAQGKKGKAPQTHSPQQQKKQRTLMSFLSPKQKEDEGT